MPEKEMMWLAGFQIPLRYKLYLLAAVAFVLGLLRWRNSAVEKAIHQLEQQQRDEADQAAKTSREVRNEIEIMDDVDLYTRASRWVRNRDN